MSEARATIPDQIAAPPPLGAVPPDVGTMAPAPRLLPTPSPYPPQPPQPARPDEVIQQPAALAAQRTAMPNPPGGAAGAAAPLEQKMAQANELQKRILGLAEQSYQAQRASDQARVADIQSNLRDLMKQADAAPPDSQKRTEMRDKAWQMYQQHEADFEAAMKAAPHYQPLDSAQKFGSAVTVLAALGGLLSRRPLTASLGAMGAAMQGLEQGNYEQFKTNFDVWKFQTDMGLKLNKMDLDELNAIRDDAKMAEDEKNTRLNLKLKLMGVSADVAGLAAGNPQAMNDLIKNIGTANTVATNEYIKLMNLGLGFARLQGDPRRENTSEINAAVARDDAKFLADFRAKNGRDPTDEELGEAHTQNFEKRSREVAAATGAGGRQQATMLTRLTAAGNEVAGALNNLVELPITATLGIFGGTQYKTADDLSAAIRRDLARAMTPQEVQDLQTSILGLSRGLATLEATGAAQGLVGLSQQMEKAAPQSHDTPITIMRKYADVRQIVERAMETVKSTGAVPDTQAALLDKIVREVRQAVPYTVHDVNMMERGGNDPRSVKAFAERVLANRKGAIEPPKVGDVQDGHRFKGGDPGNPQNWEKVQ